MDGQNIEYKPMKSTSVNLYRSDIEEMNRKGISISDTLREVLHTLCEFGGNDILNAVRVNSFGSNIKIIEKRIEKLDQQIADLQSLREEYAEKRDVLHKNFIIIKDQQDEFAKYKQLYEIGYVIDTIMYKCSFNVELMRAYDAPEFSEMERMNPGWTLENYVKVKKMLLGISK